MREKWLHRCARIDILDIVYYIGFVVMRCNALKVIFLLRLGVALDAVSRSTPLGAQVTAAADTIAFVNVNVVPMDAERILTTRTVLVVNGRIARIARVDSVAVPPHATTIHGANKLFILPGFADMHAHVRYESDLALLVANGVTTVRNMRGTPFHLDLRDRVAKGTLLGPRILTAGPVFYGNDDSGRTVENARALADSEAKAGYDFVKVYDGLPKASYEAVLDVARRNHLDVVGHVPSAVGVEGALRAHQKSIEHADEIIYNYFHDNLDDARIPVIAREFVRADAFFTPTLAYLRTLEMQWDDPADILRRPEIRYLEPETYAFWRTDRGHDSALNHIFEPFLQKLVRGMRDAGVRMLAGTDFYIFGNVAGYSIHRELQALADAGLTPYQALATATRNPAIYFGELSRAGTVAEGKRADLVVLSANPLVDIHNTTKIAGVVVSGRWLPASELQVRTDSLARTFEEGQRLVDSLLAPGSAHYIVAHATSLPTFRLTTLSQVARDLLNKQRWEDAIAVAELVTQRYPSSVGALTQLGDAFAGAGRKDAARAAYQKALTLDPGSPAVRKKLDALGAAPPS